MLNDISILKRYPRLCVISITIVRKLVDWPEYDTFSKNGHLGGQRRLGYRSHICKVIEILLKTLGFWNLSKNCPPRFSFSSRTVKIFTVRLWPLLDAVNGMISSILSICTVYYFHLNLMWAHLLWSQSASCIVDCDP